MSLWMWLTFDNLGYEVDSGKFCRGCRSDMEEGYVLWERDLEEIQTGEVHRGWVYGV